MTRRWKCICGWIFCICLFIGNIPVHAASAQETAAVDYVTVKDEQAFMNALAQGKNVLVEGRITIGSEAEANGQMRPVRIPGGITITGNGTASITSRSPIQIMGDNVVISDIEFVFSSSDSLNSIPHREIFLAGHSLTLDNVSTYLEGAGGSLGGLGGTEKELLPSVYAGAYYDTSCGDLASLTIENANKKTVLQKIELSHDAVSGQRTGYDGNAKLQMDAAVNIREGITAQNKSAAELSFIGKGNDELSLNYIKGNENTAIQVQGCVLSCDQVDHVSQIVLDENGCLQPGSQTKQLENVTIKKDGCLDLSQFTSMKITGTFTGGTSEAYGVLVLSTNGEVQIDGQIQGITQFQTGNRIISGTLYDKHMYIRSVYGKAGNFILSQKDINNKYSLIHKDGGWTTYRNYVETVREVDDLEVVSSLDSVSIQELADQKAVIKLIWKDTQGKRYTADEVEMDMLYDAMVAIRSPYWESKKEEDMTKKDWVCPIHLESDQETEDAYQLVSHGEVQAGEYTLLFFKEPLEEELVTVADVKAQKNNVLKEVKILFTSEPVVSPTPAVSEVPTASEKPSVTEAPAASEVPTVSEKPSATETPTVSEAPTASEKPSATEAPTASEVPTVSEKPSATEAPTASEVPTAASKSTAKPRVKSEQKPQGTIFVKGKVRKKVLRIYWKKPQKKVSGYQLVYAANSKFTKKKTITIKKGSAVSRKINIPKKGKKYYFKIRTFRKIGTGKKKRTVYSDWSKVYIVNT